MIAYQITDHRGNCKRCFGDFNLFLLVNRVLYACLNYDLWQEATESKRIAPHVFAHLISTDNLERLDFFLGLGANIETLSQNSTPTAKPRRPPLWSSLSLWKICR
jgi:hypothetical protein